MMRNDLDIFAPVAFIVSAGGRELAILPLKLKQIGPFAKAVTLVAPYLLADQMLLAVQHQYENLRDAVAIGTGTEPAWLDELYPDAFIALAAAVVEVNADFFARRVLPAIRTASEAVTRAIGAAKAATEGRTEPPTGQQLSPGSDSVDTGSPPALI